MPIISDVLPRLPKKRPMMKKMSSCDVHRPSTTNVPTTHVSVTSRTETYDVNEYMWTEANELESGVDIQTEQEDKSSNGHEQEYE